MHTHALVSHSPTAKLNHITLSGSLQDVTKLFERQKRTIGGNSNIRRVVTLREAHELLALNDIPLLDCGDYPHLCFTR